MADFKFDKPFMKVFGKLNDALDELINDIRHFKVSEYEYGVCNSSYKMRYISSQNVVDYIDMLARAFEKRMIETPGDIERFSVEAAKRMIEENESDSFASAMPLGYTQDPATYENLSDILVGLRNDCFNKSCYSQFDMSQRHNEAMRDLQKIVDLKFYTSMKSLVNGLPSVLKSKGVIANSKGDISDILRESIEEFIIFAYSVNIITLSQIRDYIVPIQTYEFKEDENKNVITECCLTKTCDTDLKLNLPYSINIRNLALSDNSTGFKELRKAIEYITRDPASPVAILLLQYLSKEKLDDVTSRTCDDMRTVDRLIKNDRCFCDCATNKEIELGPNFKDQLFDIAYENQFIDGSYRRGKQFHGKATPSPITDTLNMIFKIFNGCGCDLTTNEEIAMNILRVSHAIKHCAETYMNIANIELLREVLAILGEIMTRDIIMLVNNNTIVIDYGKHRNETSGPPSYLYTEYFNFNEDDDEFFMETPTDGTTAPAAAPPAPKPDSVQAAQNAKPQGSNTATTNSATGKNKVEVTYKNDKGEEKKATARFQRLLYWIRKVLASIFKKFNKDHAAEIKYVSSHADLNKKISEALAEGNGTFKINVNGLPQYKIKLDEIKPQIAEAVKKYLNIKEEWKPAEFEGMLYPVGKNSQYGAQIAKLANQNDKAVAVSNMILYGQTTAPQPHSGPVTADIFNDLINNITNAANLVQKFVQEDLVQPLTNATSEVQQKMNIQIPDNAADTNSEAVQQKQRAELIAKILTDTSNIFATTSVNTLTKDFYGISYETYAKIVNAYKAQHKDDQTQTAAQTNNQAAAAPAANNNAGGEPAPGAPATEGE